METMSTNPMMLLQQQLPRRTEHFEFCFICGAGNAVWLIDSSPNTDNRPFFPFLQYQKPPVNANKLDCKGRCLTCNVCYVFLIQQWKTYQESKTPVLKRLYWMKRSPEEYNTRGVSGRSQNEMLSPREMEAGNLSSSYYHIPITIDERPVTNVQDDLMPYMKGEESTEKPKCKYTCPLCSRRTQNKQSMKYVLTEQQLSNNAPFYSKIVIRKDGATEISNPDGKILVCSICHSNLYRQWIEYEKLSVSSHEREFFIESAGGNSELNLSCFLCDANCSHDSSSPLHWYDTGKGKPFYPFLKNFPTKSQSISDDGLIYGCEKCKILLQQQWDIFEEANVLQDDRVYRVHPSQPPFAISDLSDKAILGCFVCSTKHEVGALKRIFCNSGANMNLSFLKTFPRNLDSYFSEDTGETFVCVGCYEELRQKSLCDEERTVEVSERDDSLTMNSRSIYCGICRCKVFENHVIHLHTSLPPGDNKYKEKPVFSMLKQFASDDGGTVISCQLCGLNLLNQWSSFQQEDIHNITYRLHQIVCYICGDLANREDVGWENIKNVRKEVDIKASPSSVRCDQNIAVCDNCRSKCMVGMEQASEPGIAEATFSEDSLKQEGTTEEDKTESVDATHNNNENDDHNNDDNGDHKDDNKNNNSDDKTHPEETEEVQTRDPPEVSDSSLPESATGPSDPTTEAPDATTCASDVGPSDEETEGMKATATVPPFLNLSMRNHSTPPEPHTIQQQPQQPQQPPPSSSSTPNNNSNNNSNSNSNEHSFAAALRKLAQQAPGFPVPVIPRDRRTTSPLPPPKNGTDLMPSGIIPHPSPHPPGVQGSRLTGTPSIMAPGHMHSREHSHQQLKDVIGRHPNRPPLTPQPYPFSERVAEREEHHHRRSQEHYEVHNRAEEHHHRRASVQEQPPQQYEVRGEPQPPPHPRDGYDPTRRNPISSSPAVTLNSHVLKERPSSSIGLVHPQPVRKHHEEESIKSSAMNSMHYPTSRDTTTATMRPLSPNDHPRYHGNHAPFVSPRPHQHPRPTQSSCPVHGHESGGGGGHQHGGDERRSGGGGERPPGIPFEGPTHVQREFHSHHAQHPRMREEMQFLHGRPHPLERKEHLPSHHALEEDLRRRGLDYRWAGGVPPHLLDEQYRRHVINGSHEHTPPFKEPPHGQVYVPHFYYGRDYPIPVEPYIGHGMPPNTDPHQRHAPPVSPRLVDYYRRGEHGGLPERTRPQFEGAERRTTSDERRPVSDERREKEARMNNHVVVRTGSTDSVKSQRRMEENAHEKDPRMHSPAEKVIKECHHQERRRLEQEQAHKIPFFKGVDSKYDKPIKPNDSAQQQPNSINSLLSSKLLPDPKTELAAASILANMNRISQSPCSDEVESLTSISGMDNRMATDKPIKIEEEEDDKQSSSFESEPQFSEEKLLYMQMLGLVPHKQKRALEDDYERKRWDRKFRKFRGRPKKRSKRESTEDSSVNGDTTRPGSELDFYSGPMTRHKQQLLQEQECLLEQIQRQNNSDASEDHAEEKHNINNNNNNDNNDNKGSANTSTSSSPNNLNSKHRVNENGTKEEENHSKNFPKTSPLGDTSGSSSSSNSSNRLFPSRLLAILRDDQQKVNTSNSTSSATTNTSTSNSTSTHSNSSNNNSSKTTSGVDELSQSQHQELVDGIKLLDNSLLGQPLSETDSNNNNFLPWSGIERISKAYADYNNQFDTTHQQLTKKCKELESESASLQKNRESIQKNLVIYHNRSMDISDQSRDLKDAVTNVGNSLRTIMNS